jgi:hypothetical protein
LTAKGKLVSAIKTLGEGNAALLILCLCEERRRPRRGNLIRFSNLTAQDCFTRFEAKFETKFKTKFETKFLHGLAMTAKNGYLLFVNCSLFSAF